MTRPNRVFETLESLGVATIENRTVFASATRDNPDLTVYRDRGTGVIYLDGFYVGDDAYAEGTYRDSGHSAQRDYERFTDLKRRAGAYSPHYTGKAVTEFGCGDGAFLQAIQESAQNVRGIELQDDYIRGLEAIRISCARDTEAIPAGSQDSVFLFHVLEHLPDPMETLRDLFAILKGDGKIVVEVPHASDFLLSSLNCESFKKFTLWSQHLVLHTRHSLERMLSKAGFQSVMIEGVQRYPLSNHLMWLSEGRPGGHKSHLAALDTPELMSAYEAALRKVDATDTLVAIAQKPS